MHIAFYLLFALLSVTSFAQKERTPPFRITEYRALLGGRLSDSMSKSFVSVQPGLSAEFRVTEDHWERLAVRSFKVVIQAFLQKSITSATYLIQK